MNTLPADRREQLERWQWRSLAVGVAALLATGIGGLFTPNAFFRTYLVAFVYFLGIAHGCLVILMIYHLTGGAWGYLIRRILEAGIRTLPLMAVLFIPVGCGVGYLYLWADPEKAATLPGLRHKQIYLNVPFFWCRAVLFFALWIANAYLLSRWSQQQDQTEDPERVRELAEKMTLLSGPALIVFGITITFASVDWVMSLQPAFRSTMFGPLFVSGELLTGFACALIVLAWLLNRSPLADLVSVEALGDLGNLLFTFLVLWAYMEFFQFMLIWIADLRYDIIWYLPRTQGVWLWVVGALLLFHFAIPFFLLLMRSIKRNPRALAMVAGLLLFMHLVYVYFQILPAFPDTRIWVHWMDFVAPFGVGGVWLANFLWDLKRGPVLPLHDLNRETALHYHEVDREQEALQRELHHA